MNTQFPPRLHVILAREAPVGVVIRRGPSKQTRLILWDTSTDEFTPGQWLKARLYERRCDVSPDGKRFIYFALDGHWEAPTRGAYTAVSRPPYFTALALWPQGDAWGGGGLFYDNESVWLHGSGEPMIEPATIQVLDRPYPQEGHHEFRGTYSLRLRRDGWRDFGETSVTGNRARTWEKTVEAPAAIRLLKIVVEGGPTTQGKGVYHDEHVVELYPEERVVPLPEAEWADFDHRGRLLYAADGKLWEGLFDGGHWRPREIADFNGMFFEAIESPAWALEE